jgi:hypothetical protein
MTRKMFTVAVSVATALGLGAGAANAAVSAAAGSAWTSVGRGGVDGEITALTTLSYSGDKVAQFAFLNNGTVPALMSRSDNESWAMDQVSVAKTDEVVTSATAVGPNEVFFFTHLHGGGGRVLKFVGIQKHVAGGFETQATFSVVATFSAAIGSATVLNANDIWVFGSSAAGSGKLGVWHYNGKVWEQVSTSFANGGAVSDSDVWAASGTTMEQYDGSKWTAISVASLLPAKTATNSPSIDTVTSEDKTTYAIGSGNSKTTGGPVVILEYNGHKWVKVATFSHGDVVPGVASTDGVAGLWFPIYNGKGKPAEMLHYSSTNHTITSSTVGDLTTTAGSDIVSMASLPGTTKVLAGGYVPLTATRTTAKIYYYE